MIKIYSKTIAITLKLIFRSMLEEAAFLDDRKKSNVVPIHKRDANNLIKNYRSIGLLPIFSTAFERTIFNSLFNYFIQKKLFIYLFILYLMLTIYNYYYKKTK